MMNYIRPILLSVVLMMTGLFGQTEQQSHKLTAYEDPLVAQIVLADEMFTSTTEIRYLDHTAVFNKLITEEVWIKGDLTVGGQITSDGSSFVVGPAMSLVNMVPRFADTSGDVLKESSVFIDDVGNIEIEGIAKNGNTVSWPSIVGAAGTFLGSDGSGNLVYATPAGAGNVSTASIFTADNRLVRTDLPSGSQNVQESSVTLDDSNNLTGLNSVSATIFNGNLNGAASLNVLKAGDTMTGNLNMATQSQVRFADASGGEYVGLRAPASVGSSYTLSLPSGAPTALQMLVADAITPTNLNWINQQTNISPAISRTIYVSVSGNDITGNGSFNFPFASLAKAIDTANGISSTTNPVVIEIAPGTYTENNSGGPLTITAGGITIRNASFSSVVIKPSTLSNDLFLLTASTTFHDLAITAGGVSTAKAIDISSGGGIFRGILIQGFNTGISSTAGSLVINDCLLIANGTAINANNITVLADNCTIIGVDSGTGVISTGASALLFLTGGVYAGYNPGFSVSNNSVLTINSATFRASANAFNITNSGRLILQSSSFELNSASGTVVNIQASGAGTDVQLGDCVFNNPTLPVNNVTAIKITDNAQCAFTSGQIRRYPTALSIGDPGDASSTQLSVAGLFIRECTNDIIQQGSASLNFNTGVAAGTKITINDSSNVTLAYFDADSNNALQIGSFADQDTKLLQASIGAIENPQFDYKSSIYGAQSIGYVNITAKPALLFSQSANTAKLGSITTDRDKASGIKLLSDTGSPIGGFSALRGWDICKNESSAELSFAYQNSDVAGQAVIPTYTLLQLDGVNNQIQLPDAATQIVLSGDTNLYRSAPNQLKTDDNLVVGGLTPNRAVATDVSKQLVSSAVTDTELGFLSGVISALQPQINNKVSKTGDTMTGNLNMAAQSEVRFEDSVGGEYVGLRSPATIGSSYTLSLPSAVPTALQVLTTDSTTPTNLNWTTPSDNIASAVTKTVYVAPYGNDMTGNGSVNFPFKSIAKAIDTANGISSLVTPVLISIAPGIYVENNSGGPLTITAEGIAIEGDSFNTVVIRPNTLSNDLFLITKRINFRTLTLASGGLSTARAILATSGEIAIGNSLITGFATGISSTSGTILLTDSVFQFNGIGIDANNARAIANSCTLVGPISGIGTGVVANGANAIVTFNGGIFTSYNPLFSVSNNASASVFGATCRTNRTTFDVFGNGELFVQASSFSLNNPTGTVVNVKASGAGTKVQLSDCIFNNPSLPVNDVTAVKISDNAQCTISSGQINNYTTALAIGDPSDTSSTRLEATGLFIKGCTSDIIQQGSASLEFNSSSAAGTKITINDSSNVQLAFFDADSNDALQIGSFADQDTKLLQASIGAIENPQFDYKSSIYGSQSIGYVNITAKPALLFSQSANTAKLGSITTDRNKASGIKLLSDTGSPIGGFSALRGWDICKNESSAELSFAYQNSDAAGQAVIPTYTLLQLDGVNNQIQLPDAVTQIVLSGDTNLYRSAANQLKTDDNLVVGGLTANRAVTTDASKQLVSSAVTDMELGFLSGVTAALQPQINNKVSKTGDTMTGALTIPAGTAASPSINFTGSLTSGLFANANALSLSTAGVERMTVASDGKVLVSDLASVGVVHTNGSGELSTSAIVNDDIDAAAAIVDTKLATISSAGKVANSATTATSANVPNTIVLRDGSGGFSAGTITASLTGAASANVLKAGDTMTGALQVPAGSPAAPSINFTGSPVTGLSAVGSNLSLSTAGSERMKIASSGMVSINDLASVGVVHTNGSGELSTSSIVDSDIANTTITNSKLATVSSSNLANYIVARNALGNFSTNQITISGAVANATDVATKAYVDSVAATGLEIKEAARVVSNSNVVLSGLSTIDGELLVANDRVLLISQTDPIENGLWLAQAGAWTRPTDFDTGNVAGQAYVLIEEGTNFIGSSWLCNTPTAVIDTDPITFAQFSLSVQLDGANVGAGTGQIFRDRTGVSLNFKTLIAGNQIMVIDNADDVTIATNAISSNTPNTIVLRDGSGNFAAGTITASLTGAASANVLKAGDTMSGALTIPAGTAAAPAINFTGSLTSGLFANANALSLSTAGVDRMTVASDGKVSVSDLASVGVVHTNGSGELSTSAIVNDDIDAGAAIVDTKLATISTAGKVANSATSATSSNTPNTIVLRDGSGSFAAGIITANLTGAASANVLKVGDTMTGNLTMPAGTAASPSINFTGSLTSGLFANANALSLSTAGVERMTVASDGKVLVSDLASAGVVHTNGSGELSTSSIVNADIDAAAAIVDTKLATISTAGKVANSATTATSANTPNTIVLRDGSGGFSAGTIAASLTGAASANVLKMGDTMTGALQVPAGSAATPSINFTGSPTTGLFAATDNLSLTTAGVERMKVSSGGTVSINGLSSIGVVHTDASGNLSTSLVTNADIVASAAIVDTKLATISSSGKVANSATTATSSNTPSTIVLRDASGNFSAGIITAALSGAASANVLKAGDTMTGALTIPAGSAAMPSINFSGSLTSGLFAIANALSMSTAGVERMKIASDGTVSLNNLASVGIVHTNGSGELSTSLVVNDDITNGTIQDSKLATISSSGKVANSATTATNLNTPNTIVLRNGLGDFSAGTITAALTGAASANVLKAGDTMTGALTIPAGTAAAPSINFAGSLTSGLFANANALSLSTAGNERMKISSGGTVSINGLSSVGVVHTDASGNLSTSLIVNADVSASAAIVDTKLATIATAGKVANSATTATSSNTPNTIVLRDASGNFVAGTITAALTGAASANVLKAGDTMTGALTVPAGTVASPSIRFSGSTNTGVSAPTANNISFDTNGVERMSIGTSDIKTLSALVLANILSMQAIQVATPTSGSTITMTADNGILLLRHSSNVTNVTVNFPPNPINGQLFTILLGTTNSATLNNVGGVGGASVVNGITTLDPSSVFGGATSANYLFYVPTNSWYRMIRG